MKRINAVLNTVMASFTGVFIGRSIHIISDYKKNPELYAFQSSPWYTGVFVNGIFTLIVLVICLIIKTILKYIKNRRN